MSNKKENKRNHEFARRFLGVFLSLVMILSAVFSGIGTGLVGTRSVEEVYAKEIGNKNELAFQRCEAVVKGEAPSLKDYSSKAAGKHDQTDQKDGLLYGTDGYSTTEDTYERLLDGAVYRGGNAKSGTQNGNVYFDNDPNDFASVLPYGNTYVDTSKLKWDAGNSFIIDIKDNRFKWIAGKAYKGLKDSANNQVDVDPMGNGLGIVKDSTPAEPVIAYVGPIKGYLGNTEADWRGNSKSAPAQGQENIIEAPAGSYLYSITYPGAVTLKDGTKGSLVIETTRVEIETTATQSTALIRLQGPNSLNMGADLSYENGERINTQVFVAKTANDMQTYLQGTPLSGSAWVTDKTTRAATGAIIDLNIKVLDADGNPAAGSISYSAKDMDLENYQSQWGRSIKGEDKYKFNEALTIVDGSLSYAVTPYYDHAHETTRATGWIPVRPGSTETLSSPLHITKTGSGSNANGVRFSGVGNVMLRDKNESYENALAVGTWASTAPGTMIRTALDKHTNNADTEAKLNIEEYTIPDNFKKQLEGKIKDGSGAIVKWDKMTNQQIFDYLGDGSYGNRRGDYDTFDTGFAVLMDASGFKLQWSGSMQNQGNLITNLFDSSIFTYVEQTHGTGGGIYLESYDLKNGCNPPQMEEGSVTMGRGNPVTLTAVPEDGYRVSRILIGDTNYGFGSDKTGLQNYNAYYIEGNDIKDATGKVLESFPGDGTVSGHDDLKTGTVNLSGFNYNINKEQVNIDTPIVIERNADGSVDVTLPNIDNPMHVHADFDADYYFYKVWKDGTPVELTMTAAPAGFYPTKVTIPVPNGTYNEDLIENTEMVDFVIDGGNYTAQNGTYQGGSLAGTVFKLAAGNIIEYVEVDGEGNETLAIRPNVVKEGNAFVHKTTQQTGTDGEGNPTYETVIDATYDITVEERVADWSSDDAKTFKVNNTPEYTDDGYVTVLAADSEENTISPGNIVWKIKYPSEGVEALKWPALPVEQVPTDDNGNPIDNHEARNHTERNYWFVTEKTPDWFTEGYDNKNAKVPGVKEDEYYHNTTWYADSTADAKDAEKLVHGTHQNEYAYLSVFENGGEITNVPAIIVRGIKEWKDDFDNAFETRQDIWLHLDYKVNNADGSETTRKDILPPQKVAKDATGDGLIKTWGERKSYATGASNVRIVATVDKVPTRARLQADGSYKAGNTTYWVNELKAKTANGDIIEYSIRETLDREGNQPVVADSADAGLLGYTSEDVAEWAELSADVDTESKSLSGKDTIKVKDQDVDRYTGTVENKFETTDFTVTKIWYDTKEHKEEGDVATLKDKYTLYENNTPVIDTENLKLTPKTAEKYVPASTDETTGKETPASGTLETANGTQGDFTATTFTWHDIPAYVSDGKGGVRKAEYSIKETKLDGYADPAYENADTSVTDKALNNGIIKNIKLVDVKATKVWDDEDNRDGKRPGEVTVTRTENSEDATADDGAEPAQGPTQKLNDDNSWTFTWEKLPYVDVNGNVIIYSVNEDTTGLDDYTAKTEPDPAVDEKDKPIYDETGYDAENGIYSFIITNEHDPETIDITVNKVWEDRENNDGKRPGKITFTLNASAGSSSGGPLAKLPTGATITDADGTSLNYQNGKFTVTKDKTPVTITGLDAYQTGASGQAISYSVTEDAVDEYSTQVSGAKSVKDSDRAITVTNSYTPKTIDIRVAKVWDDKNNADNLRSPSVVRLYQTIEGESETQAAVATAEVKADENSYDNVVTWTVPAYVDGKKISYRVEENAVPNYTTTYATTYNKAADDSDYSGTDGRIETAADVKDQGDNPEATVTITNTHVKSTKLQNRIPVEKVLTGREWYENDEFDVMLIPANASYPMPNDAVIRVDLVHADVVITKNSFNEDVNAYREYFGEIIYTIDDMVDDSTGNPVSNKTFTYHLREATAAESGVSRIPGVTYSTERYEVDVNVEVQNGELVIKSVEFYETGADGARGNKVDKVNFTNTYKADETDYKMTAEKTFKAFGSNRQLQDGEFSFVLKPVGVLADIAPMPKNAEGDGANRTLTVKNIGNGVEFEDVTDANDGLIFKYEDLVTALTGVGGRTRANAEAELHTVQGVTFEYEIYEVIPEGAVNNNDGTWSVEDADGEMVYDGIHHVRAITVKVIDNPTDPSGDPVLSVESHADDHKNDFYVAADGNEKAVSAISGYSADNHHDPGGAPLFHNYHLAKVYGKIKVTKDWDDADNQDGKRPEEISVTITSGTDENLEEQLTLKEDNDWTAESRELPVYANIETGTKAKYTIVEKSIPSGYTATFDPENGTVEMDEANGEYSAQVTVTNTYEPETLDIEVTKKWDDASDQDGKRPDEVEFTLVGRALNNVVVELSKKFGGSGDTWTATFDKLAKYHNGEEIAYTVVEELKSALEKLGYKVDESKGNKDGDYTITNKRDPEKISFSVTKVWDDADNQDGIRPAPEEVVFYEVKAQSGSGQAATLETLPEGTKVLQGKKDITADFEEGYISVDTVNGTTITFENLDKYADGQEITYTVVESVPAGYTATVTGDMARGYTVTNKHIPTEPQTTTVERKIEYKYIDENGEEASTTVTQKVELTRTPKKVDPVTGDVTEWNDWEITDDSTNTEVTSPEIEGWTPDKTSVPPMNIDLTKDDPSEGITDELVIYQPEPPTGTPDETYGGKGEKQTGTPEFEVTTPTTPDGSDNEIVETKLIDPETGDPTDKVEVSEGTYTLNPDGTITFEPKDPEYVGDPTPVTVQGTDKNGKTATTTYTPHVVDNTDTVKRTITYEYNDGTPVTDEEGTPIVKEETVTFTGTVDPKTGKVTFPNDDPDNTKEFGEEPSPDVEGWTPDKEQVEKTTVKPGDDDIEEKVIYNPGSIKATPDETYGLKGEEQTGTPKFETETKTLPDGTPNEITTTKLIDPSTGEPTDKPVKITGQGTYTMNEDGTITFTPEPDFVGNPTPIGVEGTDKLGNKAKTTYTPHVVDPTDTDTATRTIHYTYLFDDVEIAYKVTEDTEQTVTLTRHAKEVDPKTGEVKEWGDWEPATFPAVTNPDKEAGEGWETPDKVDELEVTKPGKVDDEYVVYQPTEPKATPLITKDGQFDSKDQDGNTPKTQSVNVKDSFELGTKKLPNGDDNEFYKFALDVPKDEEGNPVEGATVSEDGTTVTVPGEGKYVLDPKTGNITFTPDPEFTGKSSGVTVKGTDMFNQTVETTYTPIVVPNKEEAEITREIEYTYWDKNGNPVTEMRTETIKFTRVGDYNPAKDDHPTEYGTEGDPNDANTINYPAWTPKNITAPANPEEEGWNYDIVPEDLKGLTPDNAKDNGFEEKEVPVLDEEGNPVVDEEGNSVTEKKLVRHDHVIYTPEPPEATPKTTYGKIGKPQTTDATKLFKVTTPTTDEKDENGNPVPNEIETIELIDPDTGKPVEPTVDPETGKTTYGPVPAYVTNPETGEREQVGTYTLDPETGIITFQPNETFVGTPEPAKLKGTDKNGLSTETTYTPRIPDSRKRQTVDREITYMYKNADGTVAPVLDEDGNPVKVIQSVTFTREANVDPDTGELVWGDWEPTSTTMPEVKSPTATEPEAASGQTATQLTDWEPDRDVDKEDIAVDEEGNLPDPEDQIVYYIRGPRGFDETSRGPKGQQQEGTPDFLEGSGKFPEEGAYSFPDHDEDDPLKKTVPGEGTYTLDPNTGKVTFQPEPEFVGEAGGVPVQVTDENGKTATGKYTPTVYEDEEEKTVKRTIHYRYLTKDGKEASADVVQTVTFVRKTDPATGKLGDWEVKDGSADFDEVTSPVIENYEFDVDKISALTVTPEDKDTEEWVIYTPVKEPEPELDPPKGPTEDTYGGKGDPQKSTPEFKFEKGTGNIPEKGAYSLEDPDEDNPLKKTIPGEGTYTLDPDTGKVTFQPEPDFVGDGTGVTVKVTDENNLTATGKYTPHVVDNEQTSTAKRTINYYYNDGTKVPEDLAPTVEQTAEFTRKGTVDPKTGKITSWEDWTPVEVKEVPSPDVPEYKPNREVVEGTTLNPGDNISEVVIYVPEPEIIEEEETKTITRTIRYWYEKIDGEKAFTDVEQTVTFSRIATTNTETGETTYSEWIPEEDTMEAVDSPVLDNYNVNSPSVEELTINPDDYENGAKIVEDVIYTPKTIWVRYIDPDESIDPYLDKTTVPKAAKGQKQEEPDAPADPTKEGYTFDGWEDPKVDEDGNITYVAKWKPVEEPPVKTYWVTYVDPDGTTIYLEKTTQNVGEGEPDAPADPTKDGFTFDGWDREVDEDGNITYTAKWKPVEEPPVDPEPVKDPVSKTVTRTIRYWYEKVDGEKAFDDVIQTITFTGTKTTNPDGTVTTEWDKDSDVGVAVVSPTKDGYTVDKDSVPKWEVTPESEDKVEDVIYTPIPDEPVEETIWVTYVDEDGTTVYLEKTTEPKAKDGEEQVEPEAPADPTKEGYTFTEWTREVDEDGNITYTAHWTPVVEPGPDPGEKTYWVTYVDPATGRIIMEETTQPVGEEEPPAPENPTRDGYTFDGWDRSVDGDGNVTYTAKWKPLDTPATKTYWVTYVDPDGKTIYLEKTTQTVGAAEPPAPKDPTKTGYTFEGWDRSVDSEGNVTYVAKWKTTSTVTPTKPATTPTTPSKTPTATTPKTTARTTTPKTGDGNDMMPWLGLMGLAAALTATVTVRRRKASK